MEFFDEIGSPKYGTIYLPMILNKKLLWQNVIVIVVRDIAFVPNLKQLIQC